MDLQHIHDLIRDLEIDDPAFEDTKFAIDELPSMNGAWLGAYFPSENLIVISPEAKEGVILHEMGHRHSDFYYHDLSEKAAESFRRVYQGNYQPYEVAPLPLFAFCTIIWALLGAMLSRGLELR